MFPIIEGINWERDGGIGGIFRDMNTIHAWTQECTVHYYTDTLIWRWIRDQHYCYEDLKSRWDPCFSNWHSSSSIGSHPSPIFSRSPRSLVGVLRVTESFPVAGKMRPREMITTKPITSIRITKKWRYSCPIRIMKIADTVIITINHNPNHNYCYNTIPILIIILLSLSIISY
jgi:hypothetical protein